MVRSPQRREISASVQLHQLHRLKAGPVLQAFEESISWPLLSSLCGNSNLHISVFI